MACVWGKEYLREVSVKGGKHDKEYYASYFNPGPRAFFDTLIPYLLEAVPWDWDYSTLAMEREIDGSEVSG